tara:strand:- start:20430 stop:20831 length:402 start_codon:yes stop_codon:yes gene_type:complete
MQTPITQLIERLEARLKEKNGSTQFSYVARVQLQFAITQAKELLEVEEKHRKNLEEYNSPRFYVEKQMSRTVGEFLKLRKLTDSKKTIMKSELRKCVDRLSIPLFKTLEAINPSEPNFETDEEANKIPDNEND